MTQDPDPKQPGQHGRFINPEIGILMGEGAEQECGDTVLAKPPEVATEIPTAYFSAPEGPTYYEQPVLKPPVWIWAVPAYFYAGGTAGGALVLGWAAQHIDRPRFAHFIHRCRWIGALGITAGAGLLIIDLGRPARFINMLRVFRPSSPLNVGSWLLTAGGPLAAASALLSYQHGALCRLGDLAADAAALIGMPLAGYTGVVLADTAVPIWQASRRGLPVMFVASAMAGTASLLEMMDLDSRERKIARYFGIMAKAAELSGIHAVHYEAARVKRVAKPFTHGRSGLLWTAARVLSAASLVMSLIPGTSRRKHFTAGLLGTAGAVCLRFASVEIGKASAHDPRATFEQQRRGFGAAEVVKEGARAPAAATVLERMAGG